MDNKRTKESNFIKRFFLIFTSFTLSIASFGQTLEVGVRAGGSNYLGDSSPMFPVPAETKFSSGINVSYFFTKRLAVRLDYNVYNLAGWDANVNKKWGPTRDMRFATKLKETSLKLVYHLREFNPCDQKVVPYITAGVSYINYSGSSYLPFASIIEGAPITIGSVNGTDFAIPAGVGMKYNVRKNIAVGVEVNAAKTFTDQLDYPAGIGNPDANDWYLFGGFTLSYVFGSCNDHNKQIKRRFGDCFKFN